MHCFIMNYCHMTRQHYLYYHFEVGTTGILDEQASPDWTALGVVACDLAIEVNAIGELDNA